jgi:hypothetical protein
MPHSPYHTSVYPPLDDLEEYRDILRRARSRIEEGESYSEATLLDIGDNLLKYCDFLDTKLDIKIRIHSTVKVDCCTVVRLLTDLLSM